MPILSVGSGDQAQAVQQRPAGAVARAQDPLSGKVTKLVLAVITLYAMSSIPGANGGPISWAACIASCEAIAAAATAATGGAAAPSLIACVHACWPILALPFPP